MKVKELRKILNDLDKKFDDSEIHIQGDGYGIEQFGIYSELFPTIYLTSKYPSGAGNIEYYSDESDFPYHIFLD